MKKINYLIAAATCIQACSIIGIHSDTQKIEMGCASASMAISALGAANLAGKLGADQQAAVLIAIAEISPICTSPDIPTMDDVRMQAFNSAVAALQAQLAKTQVQE